MILEAIKYYRIIAIITALYSNSIIAAMWQYLLHKTCELIEQALLSVYHPFRSPLLYY